MTNAIDQRHPDIEIYVAGLTAEQAITWLETRFDSVTPGTHQRNRWDITLNYKGTEIALMVVEKAAGKFCSLWFDSPQTPWAKDLDCAVEAQRYFDREVRCVAGGWSEGDDPDEWWQVSDAGQQLISWQQR